MVLWLSLKLLARLKMIDFADVDSILPRMMLVFQEQLHVNIHFNYSCDLLFTFLFSQLQQLRFELEWSL